MLSPGKGSYCRLSYLMLIILFIAQSSLITADGDGDDTMPVTSSCVRRIEEITIYSNKRSLGYLAEYYLRFEELHKGGKISDAQFEIARELLHGASHTLCSVDVKSQSARRLKRQIVAVPAFLGGLVVGPLLRSIFAPTSSDSKLMRYLNKMSRNNKKKLELLERKLRKIEETVNVETELLNLLSLAHLEEKRWADLRESDYDSNTFTSSVFRYAQMRARELGLSRTSTNKIRPSDTFSLPRETWRISVLSERAHACQNATITIQAIALIPSLECERVAEISKDYTRTVTKDGSCRFLGPIANAVRLPDGSLFITTNSLEYKKRINCDPGLQFTTSNGTLLVNLNRGGSSTTSCSKTQVLSGQVYRNTFAPKGTATRLVAVPYGCSGFISSKQTGARSKDLYSPEIKVLGPNGEDLLAGDSTSTGIYIFPEHTSNTTIVSGEAEGDGFEDEDWEEDLTWLAGWPLDASSTLMASASLLCISLCVMLACWRRQARLALPTQVSAAASPTSPIPLDFQPTQPSRPRRLYMPPTSSTLSIRSSRSCPPLTRPPTCAAPPPPPPTSPYANLARRPHVSPRKLDYALRNLKSAEVDLPLQMSPLSLTEITEALRSLSDAETPSLSTPSFTSFLGEGDYVDMDNAPN